MSDSGNTGRKGSGSYFESFTSGMSDVMKRLNISFVAEPRERGFSVGFEYPRREPMETSVSISPSLLEHLEKRKETMAPPEPPKPPEPTPPTRRRSTMPASQMWPDWANKTYRDPTAETRSQTRELEKRIENTDFEKVPIVGPFVGAKKEVEELSHGKKPDLVTAARTVRVGVALTPASVFPGATLPAQYGSKFGTSVAMGKVVEETRKHSATGTPPPTGKKE